MSIIPRSRTARALTVLWVISGIWFLFAWVSGFAWLGIGWVLKTWSLWSLPLFIATAGVVFRDAPTRVLRRILLVGGAWVLLLVLAHISVPTSPDRSAVFLRFASGLLGVAGTIFPLIVIALGLRLTRRFDAEPTSGGTAIVFATAAILIVIPALLLYRDLQPNHRIAVYIQPGTPSGEVQRIWDDVLSRPSPGSQGVVLPPGVASVSRAAIRDDHPVLIVEFRSTSSAEQRAVVEEQLWASGAVVKVVRLPLK